MTLTESIFWSKIWIKVGGVIFASIVFSYIIFINFFPKSPIPLSYLQPVETCREERSLPPVSIKELTYVDSTKAKINVETEVASLPDLPAIANVYKYNVPGENFTTIQKAKDLAKELDFKSEDFTKPDATHYIWEDSINNRTLQIEATNLNFELTQELSTIKSISSYLPPLQRAPDLAYSYLKKLGLGLNNYSLEKTSVFPINIKDNQIYEAQSLNESDLIRVDFTRDTTLLQIEQQYYRDLEIGQEARRQLINVKSKEIEINGKKVKVKDLRSDIVTDFPLGGNLKVYISARQSKQDKVLYEYPIFTYTNWRIDPIPCGQYLIKQPSDAVKEIQQGRGTLVFLTDKIVTKIGDRINPPKLPNVKEFTINFIQLAYLDTAKRQEFLQPIYMVGGEAILEDTRKAEFVFYIPAIDYTH